MNSQFETNTMTLAFVDWEKALQDFTVYARDRDQALWAMGDLVLRMDKAMAAPSGLRQAFAEQGASLTRFAKRVGLTPSALATLLLTAETFSAKERLPELSFEHHGAIAKALAHESHAVRRRWLKDAAKQHWSLPTLKQKLIKTRTKSA
jgi:hypothetical protein